MTSPRDPRECLPEGGQGLNLQVRVGVSALRRTPEPDSEMVSQLLLGETVTLHHEEGEFGLVQSHNDHYVGWTLMAALSAPVLTPTHRAIVPRLHTYAAPSIRAAPFFIAGIGTRFTATGEQAGNYIECARVGWVRASLLAPAETHETDPAQIAAKMTGTPYLWGGRDCLGIDCSGLVQLALNACGHSCPRDSDLQQARLGQAVENWQEEGQLRRNDLIFWQGHVGLMLDDKTLLHANAYHMAVTEEPLSEAVRRIAPLYGQPTGARRLTLS